MSLPELDRRLLDQRGAFADTAAALRRRVRRDARNLLPQRQMQKHAEVSLAAAVVTGLIAGRVIGGILGSILR
ncbi:MAG: hypothetical protein ACRD1F_02850 [Terriglobales bacterium]